MSKTTINEIEVNGIKYIPKDSSCSLAKPSCEGLKYVLVRSYAAGVHIGYPVTVTVNNNYNLN